MIKEVSYGTIVSTYEKSKTLMDAIRELGDKKTCYQEFEWLVERWNKDPLKNRQ